ncbi:uncharacterized protein LOC100114695 [Nasonia vitripennis]|uniref:DUF4806 domain-containing protein n=1 Tax=Nasonia vitripennis TaxID=7425 RepID=A0A7M7G151_NASVI|nr:uncharacterized protein LOC100114695 [Nasonia vitripennis]
MSLRSVKEFSKLGIRQQNRRVKQLLASQVNSAQRRTTVMNKSRISGPSIIRIVPARTKKVELSKRDADTVVVGRAAKSMKLEEAPSTSGSQVQSLPHKEDHKYEGEALEQYEEYEVLDENIEYLEDVGVETPKQVLVPVKQSTESCFSTIPETINKAHSQECCCTCRETLNIIMKQQQEILKCLKQSDPSILPVDRLLDLLPTMPFDDVNDFLDFDESLASNENVQDQFLIKIRRLLVSNEQKSISNIMSSILTNQLCRSISWTGVKNSITFGTSNMVGLIVDLVQHHHNLDIDVIKSRIAEWLRRCGDRITNEIRKNKKKLEQNAKPQV